MDAEQEVFWISHHDAYTWLAVALVATLAGIFRVWRNGQWQNIRHGIGVVGCGTVMSGFTVSLVKALAPWLASNVPTTLWLAGAIAILGKEFHEKIVMGTIERVVSSGGTRGENGRVEK